MGGGRRDRHRARVPHRHRRRPTSASFRGPGGAVLNYVETTYGGQTRRHAAGRRRRARPAPDLKVLVVRGRRRRGCRSSATGWTRPTASTAMFVRPEAVAAAEGDLYRAGVRVVPARRDRAGRADHGDGLSERDVGQRLPAPRGHLRTHPGDAARAVRRRGSGGAPAGSPSARSSTCSRTSASRPRTSRLPDLAVAAGSGAQPSDSAARWATARACISAGCV